MRLSNSTGGGLRRPRNPCLLLVLLLVAGLLQFGYGTWQVKELAHWDRGVDADLGCIVPFASKADSLRLLVFAGSTPDSRYGLHFYRYAPMNRYALVKVDTSSNVEFVPGNLEPWDVGDLNGDSCPELIGPNNDNSTGYGFVAAYVPPVLGGVPDSLLSRARFGGIDIAGYFRLADLNRDGKKEVTFWDSDCQILAFEWSADSLRQCISVPCNNGSDLAIGDFDGDSLIEVATTGLSWGNWITVYKCTGHNVLVPWDSTPITRINGRVFSASNLDGSHRAVIFATYFIVGGYAYLFEVEPTNGTHDYQPILIDSTLDGGEVYAQSVCGDIDGDGLDEVLWSVGKQIRVYKHTGPHQYELVWNWWNGGNNSCNLNLYDMNGNGYNEILESGADQTHIFEIEAIRVLNPNTNITLHPGDTCRIRWETFTPPRCDSVSLFLRTDTGWSLADTLVHGLPPGDTDWVWTVPNIRSNYCHVVAMAYGPGWQCDESDTFFQILPLGVEETASPPVSVALNSAGLFTDHVTINYTLPSDARVSLRVFDLSGRVIRVLQDQRAGLIRAGRHSTYWDGCDGTGKALPAGVYFCRLETHSFRISRKLVFTK